MGFEPTTSAWIPLEPPGFICNCLSYFITARVTFTCILYPQSTHMIFIIYTSCNSHLTCFRRGFIAQLVEHRTGIAEVMGSNPVGASEFFLLKLLHNFEGHFHFYSLSTYHIHIMRFYSFANNVYSWEFVLYRFKYETTGKLTDRSSPPTLLQSAHQLIEVCI